LGPERGWHRLGGTAPRFASQEWSANAAHAGHELLGFELGHVPHAVAFDSRFAKAAWNAPTAPAVAIAIGEPPTPPVRATPPVLPKPSENQPPTTKTNGTVLHDCANGYGDEGSATGTAADVTALASCVPPSMLSERTLAFVDLRSVAPCDVLRRDREPALAPSGGAICASRRAHEYVSRDGHGPQWAAGARCPKESGFMATNTQIRLEHDQVLDAAEQMLRAQRRLGALLARAPFRRGGRPGSLPSRNGRELLTLDEVGVPRHRSCQYQRLAKIDDARFEKYLADARAAGVPPTTARALRAARGTGRPRSGGPSRAEVTTRVSVQFQRHLRAALNLAKDFGLPEQAMAVKAAENFVRTLDGLVATGEGKRDG
jgi:hypothetical protein